MAARGRAVEPRYDEYGNYLGDFEVGLPEEEKAAPEPPSRVVNTETQARSVAQAYNEALPAAQVHKQPRIDTLKRPALEQMEEIRPPKRSTGHLLCDAAITLLGRTTFCTFSTNSELELMLHKADRHLIYPPGGIKELRRRDPMALAEDRERARRGARTDGPPSATITGLNIQLNTPELIEEWIKQRKKRFPTAAVVAQKQQDALRRARVTQQLTQPAAPEAPAVPPADNDQQRIPPIPGLPTINSTGSTDSSTDDSSDSSESSESNDDSDSNSDMDPERDAIPSNIPPPERIIHAPEKPNNPPETTRRRPQPRPPPPNPFGAPDLLRQLLSSEITVHIDAISQWIRFVLDNNMLLHVEKRRGDAKEQEARRNRIVVIDSHGEPSGPEGEEPSRPCRALPPVPASPTLRALDQLIWPPEPDPLIYLDPLRRGDAKPLRLEELEALATDTTMREILTPTSMLDPHGAVNAELYHALTTWDALPTAKHKQAALEIILGVGTESPRYAHEAYSRSSVPERSGLRGRTISETDLFRQGLRAGPNEARQIQQIAERVSAISCGPEFSLTI